MYRNVMNRLEEWAMHHADVIAVNSAFTRSVVQQQFASLSSSTSHHHHNLPILYPAFDGTSLDAIITPSTNTKKQYRITSLNRYERKKNLELVLYAMDWIRTHHTDVPMPHIVMAGGYDRHNVENVQYRAELGALATALNLVVDFRLSISDTERADLLHTSLVVLYTPKDEHFGIVPLEAMYCGTPVVAVNSGGPVETIVDQVTGYLCDNTPSAFGDAVIQLLTDPSKAERMGQAGHKHVSERFGPERLAIEWKALVHETIATGQRRRLRNASNDGQYRLTRGLLVHVGEALVTLMVVMLLSWLMRVLGVLDDNTTILGSLKKLVMKDEL